MDCHSVIHRDDGLFRSYDLNADNSLGTAFAAVCAVADITNYVRPDNEESQP